MIPDHYFPHDEMKQRYMRFYGNDLEFSFQKEASLRDKWASLSELVKEIKQSFSRYYNKRHHRRGTLWGERYKSLIVENGNTLINCLAYIDLNPLRAGLVQKPEDYRWNSIGCHVQAGNRDDFLSLDLGPVECASLSLRELHRASLKEFGVLNAKERLRRYRRYLYEAGAVDRAETGQPRQVIEAMLVAKERKKELKINRFDRFRCRTRYLTDSGIIGTKDFVSTTYQRFKTYFNARHAKIPKSIKGLEGVYSLKRLAEN